MFLHYVEESNESQQEATRGYTMLFEDKKNQLFFWTTPSNRISNSYI